MRLFPSFGKRPSGEELTTVLRSPEYIDGEFKNLEPTSMMVANGSMLKMMWKFFNKPRNTKPSSPIPSIKTDLHHLPDNETSIVWFGHSSYLIHINGKNILVDPVFSHHASPFSFGVPAFEGTDAYTVDDMPAIDVLLITHDHFDHLDYKTVLKLQSKVGKVVTSLGVAAHLEYWGYKKEIIHELDWEQSIAVGDLQFTATEARHFSGRSLKRNQSLWSSFVLEAANQKIFIGGDSGYGQHFKAIGEKYGPFNLAILETGQYNENWPAIHMMPEQAVDACIDLKASWMLPVHWAKFSLAFHPWAEPVERVLTAAKDNGVPVTTPRIGEKLVIDQSYPTFEWWKGV